jgi:hypothetical protein
VSAEDAREKLLSHKLRPASQEREAKRAGRTIVLLAFGKKQSSRGGKKCFLLCQQQQEELIKTLIKYEEKFISRGRPFSGAHYCVSSAPRDPL